MHQKLILARFKCNTHHREELTTDMGCTTCRTQNEHSQKQFVEIGISFNFVQYFTFKNSSCELGAP